MTTRPHAMVLLCALVGAGCGSFPPVELCGRIPDGGCPIGRGGTCDDRSCAALYDCDEGSWTEVERCSGGDAAQGGGGAATTSGDGGAGGACEVAQFDRSSEADGCEPTLLLPDCEVEAAETCAPCLTGCEDFFLCTSTGWEAIAYCSSEGALVVFGGSGR
jgi:hypothetical protein